VPEFIDPVFAKTSSKRSFSIIENERFGLVVAQTGSINSGHSLGYFMKHSSSYLFIILKYTFLFTAIRMLAAVQYLGYDKMLRLSAPNDAALGQILTFISADHERIHVSIDDNECRL
jgi:hypothetical protein